MGCGAFKGGCACVLAAFVTAGCANTGTKDIAVAGPPVTLTPMQIAAIEKGTRAALKDPDSARFGVVKAALSEKGTVIVCGIVNARNSFGGYTGDKPFIGMLADVGAADKSALVFSPMSIGSDGISVQVIDTQCKRYGIAV